MIFKAKEVVTYNDISHQPGDVFEVAQVDAEKFGWDKENGIVELLNETDPAPAAPTDTTPANQPETSTNTPQTDAPVNTETTAAPAAPTDTTPADSTKVETGAGDTSKA